MKTYIHHLSPLGKLSLVASQHGLSAVYFEQHKHAPLTRDWEHDTQSPLLRKAAKQLDEYFAGKRQTFDISIDLEGGTPFQQEVWRALQTIPYGRSCSYAALAQQIGRPKAVRALGAANGRNPLSIIIPCHRVIAANGDLQGYAGGLANKKYLLELEGRQINA